MIPANSNGQPATRFIHNRSEGISILAKLILLDEFYHERFNIQTSRGSGEVTDSGDVSDFEIITVDVVAQPSAPGAYPTAIYEHLMNARGGHKAYELAQATRHDPKAQKYLKESLINIISKLQ